MIYPQLECIPVNSHRNAFKDFRMIIEASINEGYITESNEKVLLSILEANPDISKLCDENGLLLLHRLLMLEKPSSLLAEKLIDLYPASLTVVGSIGHLEGIPLHYLLWGSQPNYSLALKMINTCPTTASYETIDHRFPLHQAMDGLEHEVYSTEKNQLLQRLIELHPLALFREIAEEVHNFLPVTFEEMAPPFYEDDDSYWKEEEEEGLDNPDRSNRHYPQEESSQKVFSIAMADGVYQLIIDRSCWSPYDKLKAAAASKLYPEMDQYLAQTVEKLSIAVVERQVRRKGKLSILK